MTTLSRSLVLGCSIVALAACGPENLGSPGANGDINIGDIDNSITNPGGTPTPTPTSGGGTVTPAAGCPTIGADALVESGTISNRDGDEWLVCTLPSVFTEDASLPQVDGLLYAMNGRVDVGTDDGPTADATDGVTGTTVNLSIAPGVIVYGATGRSYLVVQRGSTIDAQGEEDRPIVFTSRDNVLGNNNAASSQQWGGLVLLGRAPVSDCTVGANPANQIDCEQRLEGALNPPSFGGVTGDDDSGDLAYVQIRYSGFTLNSGSELQSLTTGGVGSETGISYIQSYNSSDDGVELFGGEPKLDHFIVVGAEDDSFDIDTGAKADIQYALVVQRSGTGDNALELDSPDDDFDFTAIPRTNAQFANFTFIAQGAGSQALRVRGQADLTMVNGIVVKPGSPCLRIDEEGAAGGSTLDEAGPPRFESVLFACDTTTDGGRNDINPYLGAGNSLTYDASTLVNLFQNSATEDAYTPVFDATTLSSFFEDADFVGAVSSTDNWTQGWTCDSQTVNFGSGASCLDIPAYN
ncbi:hypothetical protein [Aurantiacibacter poecillastricola]|uniref:hypothetical protein n=1 Tax=Aurantiacibacter poecillastricola TaxID=3064385 RepID=UPI00273FC4BF|nr:hypothetical protein [Aurantiacibacter sp. 219JJ12-13]MDP5260037.1 hypothetical protein [Aurantiacibacter sp. 219JJ12-13]